MTSKSCLSQDDKEFIDVDKENDCRAHSTLSHPIAYWKPGGEVSIEMTIYRKKSEYWQTNFKY